MSIKSKDTAKELKQIEAIGKALNDELKDLPAAVANALVSAIRKRMDELNIWSSGNLQQSVEPRVSETEVEVLADFYWKFVNYGVNGLKISHGSPYSFKNKFPNMKMATAINQGFANKGAGFNLKRAFAVATLIKKDGLKPRNFIEAIDDINL